MKGHVFGRFAVAGLSLCLDGLIVDSGFSTMPLTRELDASGINWLMVSPITPI